MKSVRLPLCTHRFTISGLNLERFMNTMQKSEVPLLSVTRKDMRTLECECYSADLQTIQSIAQEKGWRLTDAQPLKLSAFIKGLIKRPGLIVGLVLTVVMVVTLLQYVWFVDINDAGSYSADISNWLKAENIGVGTYKNQIDATRIERELTYRYPDVAWFHVYVYNVTLVVDVSIGVPMPQLQTGEIGDVIATHNGIVQSVEVFAGTSQVKAGDIVQKGQVLISGTERGRDEQLTSVLARGVVIARCWESQTVQMPMHDTMSEETGNSSLITQICTPWITYPQEALIPEFLAYNTYIDQIPIGGSFFPVYLKETEYKEVSMEYEARDVEEVKTEASDAALQLLKTKLYKYDIIDKWSDYCMIEGTTLAATVTVEWQMDIGDTKSP
ncbi:MAG: hypothetical protein GX096_08335 [Clostridiales bacterium]|nr:hypothetical protein [Clostridiales bacterium]